jgi:protoporphyrinogen oxidase
VSPTRERWAVVGGGMLGLTLAHRLTQHGHEVTIFEAADRVGGLASAWTVGDVTWDRHYHVTLLSDAHLRAILAELGLNHEIDWVETKTGLFADGTLSPISSSIDFARLPVLGLRDKARLAATILRASRTGDWRRLEQVPVADWLRRWSGTRTYERFWLPLLRAKLGEAYRETSAAFIWATTMRLYAARRSGLKKEMFGYVPGGYARVLERFVEVLEQEGVTLELGAPVQQVAAVDGGITLETPESTARFDQAVVTVNPGLAARMCSGITPHERELLEGVRYQGIVCASVLLERPLDGYYLTYITDDTPITGIVEMSAMVNRRHFGGKTLVYLPKYVAPDDPLLKASDDDIAASFLPALRAVYRDVGPDDVAAFRVSRVREVFPIPTIGYSTRLPPTTTSVPGLHLASSAHIVNGTLNVNETVELAERTAGHLVSLPAAGPQTVTARVTQPRPHPRSDEPVKPVASLSLDLDDRWSYLRTAGDPSWADYPSYLNLVAPRLLEVLAQHRLRATVFVVGHDAARAANRDVLAAIAAAHEVGNHSFDHDQQIHRWPEEKLEDDLARTEDAIETATGTKPEGFRGPGYTLSTATLRVLLRRGYAYDASTLPSYLGPLARAFYFRATRLEGADRDKRGELFGTFADGRRPLRPYYWTVDGAELMEMPVTTFPGVKVPIHVSYVLHLARYSPRLARLYVEAALRACRVAGIAPSVLLHPVDFLGPDDVPDLGFFPGMQTPANVKRDLVNSYLSALTEDFDVRPVGEHAREVRLGAPLRRLRPEFSEPTQPSSGAAA